MEKSLKYFLILGLTATLVSSSSQENILEKYKGKIIETNDGQPANRMMYKMQIKIELLENLTKVQYAELTEYLKNEYSSPENLFISYVIKDIEIPGYTAWLVAYSPDFKIGGPGYTKDEYANLKNHIKKHTREIIGKWYVPERPIHARIFEKKGSIIVESLQYESGDYGIVDTLTLVSNGKYVGKRESRIDTTAYFLIIPSGDLEFWDSQGLIETCMKIE